MENNAGMSLIEIKTYILDHYAKNPNAESLRDVLVLATGLDAIECAEVVQILGGFQTYHGMTKAALIAEINRLRSDRGGPDAFFEGNVLRPMRVVDALLAEKEYLTAVEDEQLRVYSNGVYREDRTRETARDIHTLLGDNVTSASVSDVIRLLKDASMSVSPRHADWVNLANGRLCLHSWKLLEHSPIHKSLVQLPVAYHPDAVCPVFDGWLADVLPAADDQFLLLQLLGYSMLQDVRFGKIAVLYGPTHTGKSTCLEILREFLGKENVSAVTLHALDSEERRFTRAGLVGKLANVSADLSSRYLSGDSQIKQIASGDSLQLEFKGVQSFTYSPFATLWASANQLPVSHDRTDAWYERLVILPFLQQHKGDKADRTLMARLTQQSELSGLLNRVLDALRVLLDENAFRETASTLDMLEQYRRDNDHVSRFLSESCELRDGVYVEEADLYNRYKEWAEDEGIKPLPKTKFRDGVELWGAVRKRKGSSERFWAFDGMRMC